MKFRLKAGAELDMLTKSELGSALDTWGRAFLEELRRGPQRGVINASANVSDGTVIIGAGPYTGSIIAPNKGFAWSVKRLTASGLATGDSIQIIKSGVYNPGEGTLTGKVLTTLTEADPTVIFSSNAVVIYNSEPLTVFGSGLTATGAIDIDGEAAEVPATMVGVFY